MHPSAATTYWTLPSILCFRLQMTTVHGTISLYWCSIYTHEPAPVHSSIESCNTRTCNHWLTTPVTYGLCLYFTQSAYQIVNLHTRVCASGCEGTHKPQNWTLETETMTIFLQYTIMLSISILAGIGAVGIHTRARTHTIYDPHTQLSTRNLTDKMTNLDFGDSASVPDVSTARLRSTLRALTSSVHGTCAPCRQTCTHSSTVLLQ